MLENDKSLVVSWQHFTLLMDSGKINCNCARGCKVKASVVCFW